MANFQIHKPSSTVNWTGRKVLGLHTGSINISEGFIEMTNNLINRGEIQIDMTSITISDIDDNKTHDDFLGHLKNDDFFAVDQHKTAILRISGSSKTENKLRVDGNLTIKNISHPVSFIASVEVLTDYVHSLGEIVIDRTLYNIRYGSGKFFQNLGDTLIYDDFILQFKLIAKKTN